MYKHIHRTVLCTYLAHNQCHFVECSNDTLCEEQVDTFLNDACASATPTAETPNISMRGLLPFSPGGNGTVLGVVVSVGLSVVLLTVVIAGWVCTCWIMKKKGEKRSLVQNG